MSGQGNLTAVSGLFHSLLGLPAATFGADFSPQDFVSTLPSDSQTQLQQIFGHHFRGLALLARETNSRLCAQGLYHLARRMEDDNHLEGAVFLYAYLAERNPPHPGPLPRGGEGEEIRAEMGVAAIRAQAQERLSIIRGTGGSFGDRFEFVGRRALGSAWEVAPLLGMGAAGLAFRGGQLGVLRWLLPGERLAITGRLGAQALAWGGGFVSELAAFTLVQKGVRSALGHHEDWSFSALGEALRSGALLMGAMHATGGLTRSVVGGWRGNGIGLRMTRMLAPQFAMFTGILGARALDRYFGEPTEASAGSVLADALGTLLQFNAANLLGTRLFGRAIRRAERRMDETLARLRRGDGGGPDVFGWSRHLDPWMQRYFPQPALEGISIAQMSGLKEVAPTTSTSSIPPRASGEFEVYRRTQEVDPETLHLVRDGVFTREGKNIPPYELFVEPFENFRRAGHRALMAVREGSEVFLETTHRGRATRFDRHFSRGTEKIYFRIRENGNQGRALVYNEARSLSLYLVNTKALSPGAGTLFLDWLATQAAREGKALRIIRIENPQLLRILERNLLVDPARSQLEGGNFRGEPHPRLLDPTAQVFQLRKNFSTTPGEERHPYELHVAPFDLYRFLGRKVRFASREGRDLFLELDGVETTNGADGFYPAGTTMLKFYMWEGGDKGMARVYLEPQRWTLHAINTPMMRRGVGTLFMDWFATQAALHGREFGVHYITNHRVVKILRRSGLLVPEESTLSACNFAMNNFDEFARGDLTDYKRILDMSFVDFYWARGRPNPELLPPSLRRPSPPRALPSPTGGGSRVAGGEGAGFAKLE